MSTHAIIIQQSTDELLRIDGMGVGHVGVCGKSLKRLIERLNGDRGAQMLSFCAQFSDSRCFECSGTATTIVDVLMLINRGAMLMFRADPAKHHHPAYVYRVDVLFRRVVVEIFVRGSCFTQTFTFTEFLEISSHKLHAAIERLRSDVTNDVILHRYIEMLALEQEHARAFGDMQRERETRRGQ